MKPVTTRIRALFIIGTLAIIFGVLLLQSDSALMKGADKFRLSHSSTPNLNAFFAPLVSASKSVSPTSANPGATLTYNVTIGNGGTTDTTGVLFSDTIDANTTLVPGSVNTSPLALNDNYTAIGNVAISVPAANGVLANDFDPDGTLPAIIAVNTAGTQGNVSLNMANGSFTFNPTPGFEGITTFAYTISDGVFSDTGVVSITVSGMIWFVDDSVAGPGDGRLSAPFSSIANFNTLAADDPGDNIFLYSGNYSGAITLLNSQKLIGEGATASLTSITGLTPPTFSSALPATGGARPAITHTGTLLTLGNGNLIRGFNVTNTGGTGITGTSFGSLTASEISITANNTSAACGAALNLNTGNPTASFTSVSANNCTNGIVLASTTGSFTVTGDGTNLTLGGNGSGGTIQNTTGAGISLSSTVNVQLNYVNITNAGTDSIRITDINGFTFNRSNISDSAGTAPADKAIDIGDFVTGTPVNGTINITNSILGPSSGNSPHDTLAVGISSGTSTWNITGSTFRRTGNSAISWESRGSSVVTLADVSGCTFAGANTAGSGSPSARGIFVNTLDDSIITLFDINNNTFTNNNIHIDMNQQNDTDPVGSHTFKIRNNTTMTGARSHAINVFAAAGSFAGTFNGTLDGNTIGNSGVANSGSEIGNGIRVNINGGSDATMLLNNNTIRQTPNGRGMEIIARNGAGGLDVTVTNNNVNPQDTSGFPLAAILIQSNALTVANSIRADVRGNTVPAATNVTDLLTTYLELVQSSTSTFQFVDTTAPISGTAASELAATNTGSTGTLGTITLITGPISSPPPIAQPIETDEQLKQGSGNSAQRLGGDNNSSSLSTRIGQWLRPVFSAFAAPTNLSLKALGNWFSPAASAASAVELSTASSAISGETVTKGIAVIPPGKIVTIRFQATVNTPFPVGVCTVSNQGSVSGSGFSTFLTNTATTTILLAPTIGACPTNITTNSDPGLCTAAVTFATPTATGCLTPTVTCSPVSGSAFPKGTTTVTCTATNGVSPNSTCSFTVTVNDNQAPVFAGCPTNINANTSAGLCTAPVTYTAPTATDACDGSRTVTCLPASGSSFPKGVTTVTCSASDTTGNSNSCSFTVTVADNQAPVLTACPGNISLNTAAGLCTAVATYTAPTANDVCDGARTVTCTPASGTAFAKGTTTVTCTASDTSGNSGSCSFTVTVADNQGPVVTCPGPISLTESPSGSGSATATFTATANDVCDGARTVTCTPASGSSFPIGTTTVNCTASDTSGNSGSCSFTVTVAAGCTITCPSNVVVNNTPGQCGANVSYAAPTASPTCGTVTCTPTSGSFFAKGTTTVTCATTAGPSCSFTVTVNDTQAPTLAGCPTNITANTAAGLCTAPVTYTAPTATDICDGARTVTCTPASGSSFAKGTTTVTCSASDASGNSASCSFTVTVNDNQAPTFAGCSTNITANTDAGLCTAAVTYTAPTANDVCDGARTVTCSPASGSTFAKGTTTVTCTASDTSGNSGSCSFTVIVTDNQGPTLAACPANITKNTDAGLCTAVATYTAPTANDVCDGARTVTCTPASGTAFAKGTTTVTCTASDTSGNSGSCSFTVTVADNQGPVVTCPGPISLTESPSGSGSATATFTATANDVCDGARTITCTPASGSSFPIGTTTVTCSATDTAGNSGSCSFTVSVGVACTISCPSNITTNNNPGQCGKNVTYPAPTTAAGCGTVTCTPSSGSFFAIGTTTVTCTTTAGPSCSFTVRVNDNEAPTVTCPANVNAVTNNTSGACSASGVSLGTASAVDNCGGSLTATGTRSDSQPLSAPYPVGTTTITWSATDAAGNTGSCTQTVTVTNPNPTVSITSPASGALFPVNTSVGFTGSFTDNTGTHTATWTLDSINVAGVVNESLKTVTASYTFTTPGVYLVSLTVNDNCGGSGSANTVGGLDAFVVVYDPNGGFVTGGGWINSPAGAYVPDPSLTGKATFGFVSKYKKGNNIPDGETEFQFKAANLNFKSTAYEWLVVAGARAQFKGSGTINNAGDYRFILTAIDGQISGGGGQDKLRMKIWDNSNGGMIYDNQFNASDSSNPTTLLGGGSIVIHTVGGQSSTASTLKTISDFDGDGKTDLAVWDGMRSSNWQVIQSSDGKATSINWGYAAEPYNDVIAPGDYDGDGKADAAVFRRSTSSWYVKRSSDGKAMVVPFGTGTDTLVPADYDGDGKTDMAVWRAKEGRWYIRYSSDNQTRSFVWGSGIYQDVPVPGDYDGDGKADLAVFRPSNGYWLIKNSSDSSVTQKLFGQKGDAPVPADYDGDGKTDIAVWNGETTYWHIINSSDGSTRDVTWGRSSSGDVPTPGDFNGDGIADIAVWRSSNGVWYIIQSGDQKTVVKQHGLPGVVPVSAGAQR